MAETFNLISYIIKRNEEKNFVILPKRWIVERIFAWLDNYRRLSKDYKA
ncbi:transposase [Cesiribacter sp. SM1]